MPLAPNMAVSSRSPLIRRSTNAALAFGLILLAGLATSCAVGIDTTTTTAILRQDRVTEVRRTVPRQNRVFAYPAIPAADKIAEVSKPTPFHGSAPYICSPSGFGQKSRCFLRATL